MTMFWSFNDVLAAAHSFTLSAPLGEPVAHAVLMFCLVQDRHGLVEALHLKGSLHPLVEIGSEGLPVEHVSDSFELADLLAPAPNSLLFCDGLLD